jgi:hypothetical protein
MTLVRICAFVLVKTKEYSQSTLLRRLPNDIHSVGQDLCINTNTNQNTTRKLFSTTKLTPRNTRTKIYTIRVHRVIVDTRWTTTLRCTLSHSNIKNTTMVRIVLDRILVAINYSSFLPSASIVPSYQMFNMPNIHQTQPNYQQRYSNHTSPPSSSYSQKTHFLPVEAQPGASRGSNPRNTHGIHLRPVSALRASS